jgi:hypothetical protein
MYRVLSGLYFIFAYLDDVIIDIRSEEEHIQPLDSLPAAQQCSLVINSKKCVLGVAAVDFLGHNVTQLGHCRWLPTWRPLSVIPDPIL